MCLLVGVVVMHSPDEDAAGLAVVKNMGSGEQTSLALADVATAVRALLKPL